MLDFGHAGRVAAAARTALWRVAHVLPELGVKAEVLGDYTSLVKEASTVVAFRLRCDLDAAKATSLTAFVL